MKRTRGPWWVAVLLVTGLLLLILSETGALTPLESVLSLVVGPVVRGASAAFDALGNLTQTSRDVRELQQEAAWLRTHNDALVQENIRLREYQAENEELRRKLAFAQENPTLAMLGADVLDRGCEFYACAEVVGQDTNPYLRYIIINAGARQGVAVGMPVVTSGAALIGRVARASANLAYVQLINDPQSRIATMLQQSRITGLVVGSPEGTMMMTDILPDELVNPGDVIITSGVGGLLPRGLIIGQVESVAYQEAQLFQEAVVRPAVDFRRLETVLVVTDFPAPDLSELDSDGGP